MFGMDMELKTRVFELSNVKYKNLSELARTMGISYQPHLPGESGQTWCQQEVHHGGGESLPRI
jgi:hypothetical protein